MGRRAAVAAAEDAGGGEGPRGPERTRTRGGTKGRRWGRETRREPGALRVTQLGMSE